MLSLLLILFNCLAFTQSVPVSISKRSGEAPSLAYANLDFKAVVDSNMGSESNFYSWTKGGSNPIRGVNLGGWLSLEPWINTDLFSSSVFGDNAIPEDEFNFVNSLGYDEAGKLLESHYSSWITEKDFEKMASLGLNAVRIPVGYWAWKLMSTDKYYQGSQANYLNKAIDWARSNKMHVLIDLHATPGSQNGYDSSGHKGFHDWSGWQNMPQTIEVLQYIFAEYGGEKYADVVMGIELVNEPLVGGDGGISQDTLSSWYSSAYDAIRNSVGSQQNIILHDGYTSQGSWGQFPHNDDSNLVYDTHLYMLYNDYLKALSYDQKIEQVCSWGQQVSSLGYKEFVGEFTAAWNADPNSIYTKTIDQWSQDDKDKLSRFVQAEFNAFEKTYGWFFWNWKMGNSDQWSFEVLVDHSVIPNPVSQRTYDDCK